MKINFDLPTDGKRHRYCANCFSEKINDVIINENRLYHCDNCQQELDRLIDIDPELKWWVDKKNGEYFHESVGILVINTENKILFFERTIFPYGFTIPAGHLGASEKPEEAIIRELEEETGINITKVTLFKEEEIINDRCRRGADIHFWHLFLAKLDGPVEIKTDKNEGKNPVWLDINSALNKKLTPAIEFFLNKYKDEIAKL